MDFGPHLCVGGVGCSEAPVAVHHRRQGGRGGGVYLRGAPMVLELQNRDVGGVR